VLRQQLRLSLRNIREALGQYLGNALMVLLACTPQERLIGCILDEGVLEDVPATRRQTALIDQLSVYQLAHPLLQRCLVYQRDGLEQLVRELPPEDSAELSQFSSC
jgi:hypothetical protein